MPDGRFGHPAFFKQQKALIGKAAGLAAILR